MENFKEKINEIFSKTGDSILKNYVFSKNIIKLEVELYEGNILNLEFKTELLYIRNIEQKKPYFTGYLDCIKLSEVLEIENGHYSCSGDFVNIMKAQRKKFNLAFGLNVKDYTHLISFLNSSTNLAFIVNENDNYKFEFC